MQPSNLELLLLLVPLLLLPLLPGRSGLAAVAAAVARLYAVANGSDCCNLVHNFSCQPCTPAAVPSWFSSPADACQWETSPILWQDERARVDGWPMWRDQATARQATAAYLPQLFQRQLLRWPPLPRLL